MRSVRALAGEQDLFLARRGPVHGRFAEARIAVALQQAIRQRADGQLIAAALLAERSGSTTLQRAPPAPSVRPRWNPRLGSITIVVQLLLTTGFTTRLENMPYRSQGVLWFNALRSEPARRYS